MQRPLLDPEIASKIRAMALARRRLSRGIKRLNGIGESEPRSEAGRAEVDRLVLLSRWILDSDRRSSALPPEPAPPAPLRTPAPIPLAEERPPTPQHELVSDSNHRQLQ